MRMYDYHHQGLTSGIAATPGRVYTVMSTQQDMSKLDKTGWLATERTDKKKGARLFVQDQTGKVMAFTRNDTLR